MIIDKIKFWLTLSELNSMLTVISLEQPQYQERISKLKRELTEYITEGLEYSKELKKTEIDSWYQRNN